MDNYKFSQDYELIPPQKQRSYPISTNEWSLIKKKISDVKDGANFWHTLGSILIGAAISTLITALINDFKTEKLLWTCWFAFFVTGISGALSFYFGNSHRQIQNKSKEDVIDFMTTIEERFQSSLQGIVVHSAKYFAEDKSIDLTLKITEMISNNQFEFMAGNELGGDPLVGKGKTLEINYSVNGQMKKITTYEGEKVKIE